MTESRNILIVEDEEADAFLLARAIHKASPDCHVRVVNDGRDALDLLLPEAPGTTERRDPCQIILLDLKLHTVDGHTVIEKLKRNPATRSIPIVVLTSSSDPTDVKTAYALGANSYIVKPVSTTGLNHVAETICAYWLETNHGLG